MLEQVAKLVKVLGVPDHLGSHKDLEILGILGIPVQHILQGYPEVLENHQLLELLGNLHYQSTLGILEHRMMHFQRISI